MKKMFSLLLMVLMSIGLSLNSVALLEDAIGIWLFEDEDDPGKDYSDNEQHGEVVGGAELVEGKFGQGVQFNGSNQCIQVPDSDILDIADDQVTITCWFWWAGAGDTWQTFVSKGPMSGTNENWAYFINTSNKHTHFIITPGGARKAHNSSMGIFGAEEWHFTAGVYNGMTVTIYMDGKLDQQYTVSGNTTPNDLPLRIGHREGSTHWWNGVLDEISVFHRALDEGEINEIMNDGLGSILSVEPRHKLVSIWGKVKTEL